MVSYFVYKEGYKYIYVFGTVAQLNKLRNKLKHNPKYKYNYMTKIKTIKSIIKIEGNTY